ncbi:hypothetical protein EVAR_48525_1 [Eumeta japonica]|uniref:Uncharacterized protein n=1 Tax=Eumeta variegata TaxID=151549 RepID=A0A4C1Z6F0_EUMVA|nr:hypothetical protein EVAR_48525_1 [Eumeta japonica]
MNHGNGREALSRLRRSIKEASAAFPWRRRHLDSSPSPSGRRAGVPLSTSELCLRAGRGAELRVETGVIEIENGTKVEIEPETKIRIKCVTGIETKNSTEVRIECVIVP